MKKSLLIMLLIIVTCSAGVSSFAQASRTRHSSELRGITAEFETIKAFNDGQPGVFIRWEMKAELGNLGFFVYRMGENGPEMVSQGMIMSSYSVRERRTLNGGTYEMYDPLGTLDSVYFISTSLVNGDMPSTDPFSPTYTADFLAATHYTKAQLETALIAHTRNMTKERLALPSGLQAIVNRGLQRPDPRLQRMVVTQSGVKIGVKKEGMYRVTRAELQSAGFDVNSNSANWRLFSDGNEQAIIVGAGDQYIEFCGKGLDTRETDTRTYFLISGDVAGRRMIPKVLPNLGSEVSNNYRATVDMKERTSWDPTIHNGDTENYFGRPIYYSNDLPVCPSPNPHAPCLSFDLTGIDPAGLDALFKVNIEGFYPLNGNRTIRVFLNGHEVGSVLGNDQQEFSGSFSVPAASLVEGQNFLYLAEKDPATTDYFDSIQVTFSRKYVADQNSILFFSPGFKRFDVNGFTSSNIRVFDITADGNPQPISGLPITQNGSTFSVSMPANRALVMYGVEDSALLQAESVTPDNASSLATPNNTADMIIISYSAPDFMSAAEAWANYRRSTAGGGFTVKVVDVADIYDEFNYGARSGLALNHFLQYAKNSWQSPSPRYVLIIGDASWDPRDYEGFGDFDLVPTGEVDLIYHATGSDEALADFDHDGVADMAIGRIPARTADVVTTVFNKTTAFEVPAMQSLDRGFLCAFDLPFGFDFNAMCQVLDQQLPAGTPSMFINRGLPEPNPNHVPDPAAHGNLINGLNPGKYIVNYAGHGSSGTWASVDFFSVLDAPMLTNTNRQSIFTMLTCLNGLFNNPKNDSLAEALLKSPSGGGVATWASATDTTPDYQLTMGVQFYHQIGLGNIKRMGDLVTNAKATVAGSDVGYSWVLLADPALKVRP
jgi:hypothetical protein